MRLTKIGIISIVLILTILTVSVVSAAYTRSYVQGPSFVPYTGEARFPLFDRSLCGAGQDFILQVSPSGCTPSVVRSDLLEDQRVPVFCPITATQLNPLIDIEAIYQMSFRGDYPPEVQGISYLPARAALGRYGAQINNPVLSNIGYAIIILKQQRNASEMPDSVSGNLTARMKYNIKNAFGVGQANFYLPEIANEEEWNENYKRYSFWDGRGYLRAEAIDEDSASISIYSDRETYGFGSSGEKRKLSSANLKIGERSHEIPIPGFDYCLGTMQLQLNGLESPDTRVKLNINGDIIEVKDNEKFLDNKCRIRDIEKQGIIQKTTIRCDEDERRSTFNLRISPRVNLNIGDTSKEYELGDKLYLDKKGEKTVYLAYITTRGDTGNEADLTAGFVAIPGVERERLTDSELKKFAGFFNRAPKGDIVSLIKEIDSVIDPVSFTLKSISTVGEVVLRYIIQGISFKGISFQESREIFGKNVILVGYAGAHDAVLSGEFKNYYEKAIEDYDNIIDGFSSEKYPSEDVRTLGEKALFNKIEFTWAADQKKTTTELCNEFQDEYPNSKIPDICNEVYKLSSPDSAVQDVEIDGRIERISFDGIKEPSFKEFGAIISVRTPNGTVKPVELMKDEEYILDVKTGAYIQLLDVNKDGEENSVKIRTNLREGIIEGVARIIVGEATIITLKEGFPDSRGGYTFSLQKVNLKKLAKVSVIPNIRYSDTTADFSFRIGIEKRGIELSPEKTAEKIESLNQTISKWENINDKLGKVVSGFKTACLGVGTTLTVKNFFANLGGRGIARNKVMRSDGGWFEICEIKVSAGEYSNIDSCLLGNSDSINAAVDAYADAMKIQNKEFEELQIGITEESFLGEDVVNTDELLSRYLDTDYKNELSSNLAGINTIRVANKDVAVSDIIDSINSDSVLLAQARNLQLNSGLLSSSDENVKNIALSQIKSDLSDIWVNNENEIEKQGTRDLLSQIGILGIGVDIYSREGSIEGIYDGWKTPVGGIGQIPGDVSATSILYGGQVYILQLEKIGTENYRIVEVYDTNKVKLDDKSDIYQEIQSSFSFKKYDSKTYENHYDNAEIRYYEIVPYKGLPSIVPFDVKNGWYAAIKSTLPIGGNIKAYDDSGRISSFWLCNVGQDGREEFNSGIGDDICEMINLGTGQPYNQFPGLEAGKASQLITKAVRAIEEASRRYRAGVRQVSIQGQAIDVGEPAINIPDIQCQDFMSPSDCNLLFNVCDPVVCPSSRCDLGGTYPVKDVVQSGIIGSLALCLSNFPEVKVPICLSGVHAGLEGYLSVLDSYQECLQTSLETGQTVGICDEIYSIHMCEFFWRQSLPLVQIAIPKIIGAVLGQNVRGGGEYLGVQDAWQKATDSVNYFAQYYAANSFKAFKARTAEGVGTEICKNFVSLTTPQGGNLLDALVTPDSPSQFYGRFDEIPFTTATSPPMSHYKVFYHIYAGKDLPAYFRVYLHGTGSSFFQDTSFRRIVAQGFIKAGDYETQTLDFTAPSGYQEMCIIVNGQEECGFKQVTTEFGINYITEQYVAQQASQTDIKTEAACVSGTPSVYSLLSPNLQAGVEEMINPAIYNRGITRICATDNPGKATDPAAGTESARWIEVGYCGNEKIKCWLDTDSVKDTVKSTAIEDEIIEDVTQDYIGALKQELGYVEDFDALVEEIKEGISTDRIEKIDENYDRVFYNSEKGYLTLLRADAYAELALVEKPGEKEEPEETPPEEPSEEEEETEEEGEEPGEEEEEAVRAAEEFERALETGTISPIFELKDGGIAGIGKVSTYYSYSGNNWYFSFKGEQRAKAWFPTDKDIPGVWTITSQGRLIHPYEALSKENQEFTIKFIDKSYSEGLKLLIDRTIQNEGKGFLSNVELSTDNTKLSYKGRLIFEGYSPLTFYFEYDSSSKEWKWSDNKKQWFSVSEEIPLTAKMVLARETPELRPLLDKFKNLIRLLEGEDFYEGVDIIFWEGFFFFPIPLSEETCSTEQECKQLLGAKIIEIAETEKVNGGVNDASVEQDTGAKSFECLALMVARTESNIRHCSQYKDSEGNPLYCEGDTDELIAGDMFNSLGIMQINTQAHPNVDVADFEENVNYGIDLLIGGYNSESKEYVCNGKTYRGWTRALRGYNGWNIDCSKGNVNYVEDVISYKDEIEILFPEICS